MTPHQRELRFILTLMGLTILWATVALWYHRRWLELLTVRTDDLSHATDDLYQATRYLVAREDAAGSAPGPRASAAPESDAIIVSWPETGQAQGDGGAADDGAVDG